MCRHCLVKGTQTKMLGRFQRMQYLHGILEEVQPDSSPTLCDGDLGPDGHSILFSELVPSQLFHLHKFTKYTGRRPHINVGEVYSILLCEERLAALYPCHRTFIVGDSRVAASVVAKGRSNSSQLNNALCKGLATLLGADIYTYVHTLPSKLNPSDDPTRDAPLRHPEDAVPA